MRGAFPECPLVALDTLWFQVSGTLCNLSCKHCFISCSPSNHAHEMMTLEMMRPFLAEAVRLGVRDYYFTGGEPFMNRQIYEMIAETLAVGPLTVLTNGVLINRASAERLAALAAPAEYSLDLRISLDGWDAATNDPIRGAGTFDRIVDGMKNLAGAGLNPVITVTEACEDAATRAGRTRFLELLRDLGLTKPRLKVMPLLRLGAEAGRLRAYAAWETLEGRALAPAELESLQCSSSRMVTARGVWVCPILLDDPGARMGDDLEGARRPFALRSPACHTCHVEGLSCRT